MKTSLINDPTKWACLLARDCQSGENFNAAKFMLIAKFVEKKDKQAGFSHADILAYTNASVAAHQDLFKQLDGFVREAKTALDAAIAAKKPAESIVVLQEEYDVALRLRDVAQEGLDIAHAAQTELETLPTDGLIAKDLTEFYGKYQACLASCP